jgi:threonine synthase
MAAYHLLAQEEGIFAEPASAACVAGLLKHALSAKQSKGPPRLDLAEKTVVCVITGHGLKDPETALADQTEMTEVPAELDAVERAMALG